MKITLQPFTYAVCRLELGTKIPDWAFKGKFFSINRTDDELSIVCAESQVPSNVKFDKDWRLLKVEGPLDFNLTGILSGIANCLAQAKVSIFAISTYDTDYVMVKSSSLDVAISSLKKDGYQVD